MTLYLFSPDTWYVMMSGSDKDGCGRTPGSACLTLLYLLQQENRTHLPPSTGIRIATDKSVTVDQQAAVSAFYFKSYLDDGVHDVSRSLTIIFILMMVPFCFHMLILSDISIYKLCLLIHVNFQQSLTINMFDNFTVHCNHYKIT